MRVPFHHHQHQCLYATLCYVRQSHGIDLQMMFRHFLNINWKMKDICMNHTWACVIFYFKLFENELVMYFQLQHAFTSRNVCTMLHLSLTIHNLLLIISKNWCVYKDTLWMMPNPKSKEPIASSYHHCNFYHEIP